MERFDRPWACTGKGKRAARVLAERCKYLEAEGKPVNKMTAVLNWQDRVQQQPASAGKGRWL